MRSVSSLLVEYVEVVMLIWMSVGTPRSRIRCRRIGFPRSLFWRSAAVLGEVLWVVVVEVLGVARVPRLLSFARPELGIFGVAI